MCRRARSLLACVLVVGAVVVSVGCTSSGTSSDPTTSVELPGPGSEIVTGLDVQPGSHLLGTAFPAATTSAGALVLIAVDGDPADVVGSYQQALTDIGYRFGSADCGQPVQPGDPVVCEIPPDPSTTGAGTAMLQIASPGSTGRDFATTILLSIAPGDADTAPPSSGGSTQPNPPGTIITGAQAIRTGALRAVPEVDPPRVGEPVAATGVDGDAGVVVVEGSELPARGVPLNGVHAGWSAVALVTGDPVEVANAYLGQRTWDTVHEVPEPQPGDRLMTGGASVAGGPALDLMLVPVRVDDPGTDGDDDGSSAGAWWMLIRVTLD